MRKWLRLMRCMRFGATEIMQMAIKRGLKRVLIGVLVIGVGLLAVRSYRALGGPALQAWHTFVPAELHAGDLDRSDWARYLAQEGAIFESVRTEVSQKLEPGERARVIGYGVAIATLLRIALAFVALPLLSIVGLTLHTRPGSKGMPFSSNAL